MEKKLLDIRIVKIIDRYKVVINKGKVDGIHEYMRFLIYEEGEKIIDPKTNKDLGVLEIAKAKVIPHHIQDSMTTLESDDYELETSRKVLTFTDTEKKEQKPLSGVKLTDSIKLID